MDQGPFTPTQANISRTFNAIGIAILFYDQLLSIDDEVEFIWKAQISAPKVSFLMVRYIMPAALFVNAFQQSYSNVMLPETFCKSWFDVAAVLFILVVGIENFLVLLHVWILNERKKNFMKWTFIFYLLMQAMTVGWTIAIIVKASGFLEFRGNRQNFSLLCSATDRGIFPALYAPTVVFESVMLVLVIWATYVRSLRDVERSLLSYLINDGFVYILILFIFRVANMLITASAPAPMIYTSVCFGCAISAATVCRLILSLRKDSVLKRRSAMQDHAELPLDGDLIPPVVDETPHLSREANPWYKMDCQSDKYAPSDGHRSLEYPPA